MKNQKGITLIALIITIIVLLILAVVTINSIKGDGIIRYAQNAADDYTTKANEEQGALNTLLSQIEESTGSKESKVKGTWIDTDESGDINIGDEVSYGNENFYVISEDNTTTIKLLAKYNLNADGTVQDTTGASNPCAFSTTPYWAGEDADLSDNDNPDGAMAIAKAYGVTVTGIEGRLMTYEEAEILKTKDSEILYGIKETSNKLEFWLGSASGSDIVWIVDGNNSSLYGSDFFNDGYFGVRPVIEISKSAIN